MRYDDLKLERLTPDGLPLNDSAQLVSRGAINKFFLNAFDAFYNSIRHEVRAVQAPFSLDACLACDDDELNGFLQEAGAAVFYPLDHDIKARFVNALAVSQLCSDDIIDALTKYAFERSTVTGRAVYDGCAPYHFKILLSGDITRADLSSVIGERINTNVNLFNTCTEMFDGFDAEQVERNAEAVHVGGEAVSACQTVPTFQAKTPTFYDYGQNYATERIRQSSHMYILGNVFFASNLRKVTDENYNLGWAHAYEMTPSEGDSTLGSCYFGPSSITSVSSAFSTSPVTELPAARVKRVLVHEPGQNVREVSAFGFTAERACPDDVVDFGRLLFGFGEEIAEGSAVCIFGTSGGRCKFFGVSRSSTMRWECGYQYKNVSPYREYYRVYQEYTNTDGDTRLSCLDYPADDIHSMRPFGLKFFFD